MLSPTCIPMISRKVRHAQTEPRRPAAHHHGEGDGSIAATQPLGGLPAHRGRADRGVQAGRTLVRADRPAQAEAGAVVRGGTRRHGKGWGWFFSAPDPATGKRRFYSKNGFPTKKAAQEALSAELARFHKGAF